MVSIYKPPAQNLTYLVISVIDFYSNTYDTSYNRTF